MEILTENYEWVFSGIGVAILIFTLNRFFNNKNSNSTNSNEVNIVNNLNLKDDTQSETSLEANNNKKNTSILFIDDKHLEFRMVSILKKAGWSNTKSVRDVTDLDDNKVIEANIIFVDINGVGKTLFEDEGLGLASALKKRYTNKSVVIYSAETSGDRFHKALREVDDCLPKNAEPYQFINLVENLAS